MQSTTRQQWTLQCRQIKKSFKWKTGTTNSKQQNVSLENDSSQAIGPETDKCCEACKVSAEAVKWDFIHTNSTVAFTYEKPSWRAWAVSCGFSKGDILPKTNRCTKQAANFQGSQKDQLQRTKLRPIATYQTKGNTNYNFW